MISYDLWLSNDVRLNAIKARRNETSAARIYAGMRLPRAAIGIAASMLRKAWQILRTGINRRTAISELHRLDDRLLEDIGVSRGQIAGVVGNAFSNTADDHVERQWTGLPLPQLADEPIQKCEIIPLNANRRTVDAPLSDGDKESHVSRTRTAA